MRVLLGAFWLLCGTIVILLVGYYGHSTTDDPIAAWIVAFMYGTIATGGTFRACRSHSRLAHQQGMGRYWWSCMRRCSRSQPFEQSRRDRRPRGQDERCACSSSRQCERRP